EAREEEHVVAPEHGAPDATGLERPGREVDAPHLVAARSLDVVDERLGAFVPGARGLDRVAPEEVAERERGIPEDERARDGGDRQLGLSLARAVEDEGQAQGREERSERRREERARCVRHALAREERAERVEKDPGEEEEVAALASRGGAPEAEDDERRRRHEE